MARKLWLAQRIIEYETNDVLGVFTSKKKAIEECQRFEDGHSGDEPRELDFYQHQTSEKHPIVFLANGANYEYCIQEIEADKSLVL